MRNPKITRRQILKGAGAAGVVVGALGVPVAAFADSDEERGRRVRWDIVLIGSGCVSPGGTASAASADGAVLTLTGSGTFPNVHNRCAPDVTGGGTWTITPGSNPACFSGSGTYRVTELLSWAATPGHLSRTPLSDCIGEKENSSSGLAKLRVRYSNGSHGVLTVSCDLPPAPNCIFEGITASMDWEDFYNREPPTGGVDPLAGTG
jgi:hypothetical protein